jgi:hypothetical protein
MDLRSSLWEQRDEIGAATQRIQVLHDAVGAPADLNVGQWAQLYALAIEFRPDLIIDLGRGYGNSTCALTDAANRLGNGCRVVSIGFRDDHAWPFRTEPRLRNVLPSTWFESLTIIEQDVRKLDFSLIYDGAKRVLLFWDMLGYGVSRHIVDNALPALGSRDHLVIVKDVTDGRYHSVEGAHRMNGLLSMSNEVRVLGEFLLRNGVAYATAEHELRLWHERKPEQVAALVEAWGDGSQPGPTEAADWIYFEVPAMVKPNPGVLSRIRQLVAAGG